jgi:hypothetical protein
MVSITKQDVEEALDEIDQVGIPHRRRSTSYCLIARDKHYPPKHVLRLIYKKKGAEVSVLKGGELTNKKLREHGYVIEKHKCRNPNFKIIE